MGMPCKACNTTAPMGASASYVNGAGVRVCTFCHKPRNGKESRKRILGVAEKHQRRIAVSTLKMTDIGAAIMGGMNKADARQFLRSIGENPRRYETA